MIRPCFADGCGSCTSRRAGLISYAHEDIHRAAELAQFFARPWSTPAEGLPERDRAAMLGNAAFTLNALGRMADGEKAATAALAATKRYGHADHITMAAFNVAVACLTLGDISSAATAAREAVIYADSGESWALRVAAREKHADIRHQAGDLEGAAALFAEAGQIQAGMGLLNTHSYTGLGYEHCELLLTLGQAAEARRRAEYAVLDVMNRQADGGEQGGGESLALAMEMLSLGRAEHALALAPTSVSTLSDAARTLDSAVDSIRKSGQELYLPRGLLARAACLRDVGEWPAAARDLKETCEIAERGEMRLVLTDWHLESARLLLVQMGSDPAGPTPGASRKSWLQRIFGAGDAAPAPQNGRGGVGSDPQGLTPLRREAEEHVKAAARLIEETGYHRRDRELAELRGRLDAGG